MSLREKLETLGMQFSERDSPARRIAVGELIAAEEKERVLKSGAVAPHFALSDPDTGPVSSTVLLQNGPILVTFYRGLWCPFCRSDLRGLEEMMSDFRAANTSVIAISHELSSNACSLVRQTYKLSFPLLDDEDGTVAEAFGVRWSSDDVDVIEQELGLNIITMRDTAPWILPMQARYVIGGDGTIIAAEIAFNYNERTEPNTLLAVLTRLAGATDP